jgi:hypothetical protein
MRSVYLRINRRMAESRPPFLASNIRNLTLRFNISSGAKE